MGLIIWVELGLGRMDGYGGLRARYAYEKYPACRNCKLSGRYRDNSEGVLSGTVMKSDLSCCGPAPAVLRRYAATPVLNQFVKATPLRHHAATVWKAATKSRLP